MPTKKSAMFDFYKKLVGYIRSDYLEYVKYVSRMCMPIKCVSRKDTDG